MDQRRSRRPSHGLEMPELIDWKAPSLLKKPISRFASVGMGEMIAYSRPPSPAVLQKFKTGQVADAFDGDVCRSICGDVGGIEGVVALPREYRRQPASPNRLHS